MTMSLKMSCRLTVCAFLLATAAPAQAQMLPPKQPVPSPSDMALAAKCKAASYVRRPAGQMATTMRDLQIKRCISNKGFLD
jgi:hypothetical protein